ncbi:MAG: gfo/Idh/MocA family oxidoreductase, partial [Sphingobacteriales bacterium]
MSTSRRIFIRNSSLLAAGTGIFSFLPQDTLALLRKRISANDRIGVGVIGLNGMGWSNISAMLKANPETHCVAICDVDQN